MNKDEILKYFNYNKKKGHLTWKWHWDNTVINKQLGTLVGNKTKDGYLRVTVNYKSYKVHRLIWCIEKETWPKMIDHVNGNKIDNRIQNLRAASNRINQSNRHTHRNGRLVGTDFHKESGRWRARITINKREKYIGLYGTELKAHNAYIEEVKKLYIGGTNGTI